MSRKPKLRLAPVMSQPKVRTGVPREVKIVLAIALPFGALAAIILSWQTLFPVPPEQLVEVAWTHECSCASSWMKSLRAEGYTVRDVELDDLTTMRRNWRVPYTASGCHPASYMGYFIDGHFSAENLRRIARERPLGVGLKLKDISIDAAHVDEGAKRVMLLVDQHGTETPWP